MSEKSTVDILIDYANNLGLKCETHQSDHRFYLSSSDAYFSTKYVIFQKGSYYFCAFDSYTAKAYSSKVFCGIYKAIKLAEEVELKVYKKDWMDIFLLTNKKKTGITSVDSKITITSKNKYIPSIISEVETRLFLEISEKIQPVNILIKNNRLNMIKDLSNKKIIGVETNQWIYKKEELDFFLEKGEKLLDKIVSASAKHR